MVAAKMKANASNRGIKSKVTAAKVAAVSKSSPQKAGGARSVVSGTAALRAVGTMKSALGPSKASTAAKSASVKSAMTKGAVVAKTLSETKPSSVLKPAVAAAKVATAPVAELPVIDSTPAAVAGYAEQLFNERSAGAPAAARAIDQLLQQKPESLVPLIDKLTTGILGANRRLVQTAAEALPVLTRLAPARVARQLDRLKAAFANTSPVGQDGLVRTFAALCTASVAYQKRLEPVLTFALEHADGKVLQRWTETILPALKGEPHARARAVVESRLYIIPRPMAQKLADFLGIKLRPKLL